MAASGKLDLVRGDSHLAGNLLDGSLEGPLRIDEHDRPQASLGYRQGQLHGASTLFHPNGKVSAQLAFVDGKLHGAGQFPCRGRLVAAQGALPQRAAPRRSVQLFRQRPGGRARALPRRRTRRALPTLPWQWPTGLRRTLPERPATGRRPAVRRRRPAAGQRGQAHGALALVVDQAGGAEARIGQAALRESASAPVPAR